MIKGLTIGHWLTLHGLITVAALLWYVVAVHVLKQRRNPTAAIAWILFILLLPYVALPAFLAFGSRKAQRRSADPVAGQALASRNDSWAVDTLIALGLPAPVACRDLLVHADGHAAWLALLEVIDGAQESIDLCTFILGRDAQGAAIIERLGRKARAGVRVRVLLDGIGNLLGGRPAMGALTDAGGEYALFAPPLQWRVPGRTNLRDHRKLLIADAGRESARLWGGGRNLAAEYFEGLPGELPWRDLTFDLRGPVIAQAAALFEQDWAFATGRPLRPAATTGFTACTDAAGAQLLASGPDQADDTFYDLLVTAAYRADRRIVMVTPYFVPDASLLMALCLAARRGISVDLLLPARSNHRLSDLARCRALRSLAEAGGHVWLAAGMLHAKLVVVDESLALAGTANLDNRSLFLNFELMFAFHSPVDVQGFDAWFQQERFSASRYQARPPGLLRDLLEGLLLWLGFQM